MAPFVAYLPHLLYSTALTSIAMHHLAQRKALEADRAHVAAQLSILGALRARLAAGEDVPEREFARQWRLARSHDVWRARAAAAAEAEARARGQGERGKGSEGAGEDGREEIGWKEVLLGRRFDTSRSEELDRKDLERVRKEVEETS
ncbi:hypothetical protein BD413DRAFT_606152 [Trametes elegans]|nr:hypothetical protein BD413DRAFT_606152 [Trametes elegans]